MTPNLRLTSALLFLLSAVTHISIAATVACHSDGVTDVTLCLQTAINAAQTTGTSQVFLGYGTYLISAPITIPQGVQLIGLGRGDQNFVGTVIRASGSFPIHGTVIAMGSPGASNTGVVVRNLTIDGEGRADYGLQNVNSGALSYAQDILVVNIVKAGLDVEGPGASGSGPFLDLEIYPLNSGSTSTNCILVHNVPHFLGVKGATCNGGGYKTRPAVAVQADGDGIYSDFHVESFATAVNLGSSTSPADGIIWTNGQFGPNVDTGITISPSVLNQNLSLFGFSCYSCSNVIRDLVMGNAIYYAIGFYLEGNGPVATRKIWTSDSGTANHLGYDQSSSAVAKPHSQLRVSTYGPVSEGHH